jgi:hypothetical protein
MGILRGIVAVGVLGLFLTGHPGRAETPPPKTPVLKKFTNFKEGLTGERAEHYADFSFEYPEGWTLTRLEGAKDSNFVTAERRIVTAGGNFTLEKFAVGTNWGKANGSDVLLAKVGEALKKTAREELVGKLKKSILEGFPNSKITREGVAKLGSLDGYEICFASYLELDDTFRAMVKKEPKLRELLREDIKKLDIWGRFVLIPDPKGGENGIAAILLGTNVAPELREEKDLGEKGELPLVLRSLKLGKPAKE